MSVSKPNWLDDDGDYKKELSSGVKSKTSSASAKIPNYFTNGQVKSVKAMLDWYNSDKLLHRLKGPAGTGKTTVLKTLFDNISSTGILITAPTHKAVRIASEMTGVKGHTLQKLLGLRPNYDLEKFDPNNIQFDPKGKRSIGDHALIIIDEASMVSANLKRYVEKESNEHTTKSYMLVTLINYLLLMKAFSCIL
jgi:ATP-dependent exoDNAse (exonuclease V), alpha subunit - helicase superfamily I member